MLRALNSAQNELSVTTDTRVFMTRYHRSIKWVVITCFQTCIFQHKSQLRMKFAVSVDNGLGGTEVVIACYSAFVGWTRIRVVEKPFNQAWWVEITGKADMTDNACSCKQIWACTPCCGLPALIISFQTYNPQLGRYDPWKLRVEGKKFRKREFRFYIQFWDLTLVFPSANGAPFCNLGSQSMHPLMKPYDLTSCNWRSNNQKICNLTTITCLCSESYR